MNQPEHTAAGFDPPRVAPTEAQLERAAKVLNEGRKVAIVLGAGARGAAAEVEQVAQALSAPIAKALLGKDVLRDDSPYSTGTIGVFGTTATATVMEEADMLLLIGTSFPYISYLPDPKKVRGVQIDINPERIALRFPVEAGLVGDARETLKRLLPLLQPHEDHGLLDMAQEKMKAWWQLMEERGTSTAMPMRPQTVAWELGRQLDENAIICGDSGQNTLYAGRQIKIRGQQRFSCSGLLASMGCALPYAIGAQVAYPGRQVIAFAGDGGFTMTLGDLATCVKYQLPIKIVVLKNNTFGMIRWEQMMYLGNPEYATDLQSIDFVQVARGFGCKAFHVEHPDQLPSIIEEALTHPGPVVIEALVDPNEPLMPGKMKPEIAEKLGQALRRGQPNSRRIGLTLFRDAKEDPGQNRTIVAEALNRESPSVVPPAPNA